MGSNRSRHTSKILLILDAVQQRQWQSVLAQRLRAAGYEVGVLLAPSIPAAAEPLDRVLGFEARRFGPSLASLGAPLSPVPMDHPDLLVDLTGQFAGGDAPMLQLRFNGQSDFADGLGQILAHQSNPIITTHVNELPIGLARPMVSDRIWLSRLGDDILAGALGLLEQSIARFFAGALNPIAPPQLSPVVAGFWRHYLPGLARHSARRLSRQLLSTRPFYWQVAYRHLGQAASEANALAAEPRFTILPDDGKRFYADPFALQHEGRSFLFLEEYPYKTAKGVISVAELGPDGAFGTPRIVLEEPYHLSYPQVFALDGEIFMLPESGGARRLVLYRAALFPDHWVPDTILLSDVDINDATILFRDGMYWLFGTSRHGVGSVADTMVVFHAPALRGPWTPHMLNPIAIDRSAARPGGAFIEQGGRTFLPVQDGERCYGGGLGMMELLRLDREDVVFAPPVPITPGAAWNRQSIHTLNRAGALEVTDSAG